MTTSTARYVHRHGRFMCQLVRTHHTSNNLPAHPGCQPLSCALSHARLTSVPPARSHKVLKRRLRQARYRERRKVREASDADKIKAMETRIQNLTTALSARGPLPAGGVAAAAAGVPGPVSGDGASPAAVLMMPPATTVVNTPAPGLHKPMAAHASAGSGGGVAGGTGAIGEAVPVGAPQAAMLAGAVPAPLMGSLGGAPNMMAVAAAKLQAAAGFSPFNSMTLAANMLAQPPAMMPHHSVITPALMGQPMPGQSAGSLAQVVTNDSALAQGWYRVRADPYALLETASKLLAHASDAPAGGVSDLQASRAAAGLARKAQDGSGEESANKSESGDGIESSSNLPSFVAAAGWKSAMFECAQLALRDGALTPNVQGALRGQMVDDLSVCHRALGFLRARINLAEKTSPCHGRELQVTTSDCHALTLLLGTFSHMFVFFAAGMHAAGYVTAEDTEFFAKFEELQAWDNNVMAAFEALTGASNCPSLGQGGSVGAGSLHPHMQIIYLMHARSHHNLAWWLMSHRPGALTAMVTLFAVHLPLISRLSVYKSDMSQPDTANVAVLRSELRASTLTLLNEAVNVSAGRLNLQKLMDEKVFKLTQSEEAAGAGGGGAQANASGPPASTLVHKAQMPPRAQA